MLREEPSPWGGWRQVPQSRQEAQQGAKSLPVLSVRPESPLQSLSELVVLLQVLKVLQRRQRVCKAQAQELRQVSQQLLEFRGVAQLEHQLQCWGFAPFATDRNHYRQGFRVEVLQLYPLSPGDQCRGTLFTLRDHEDHFAGSFLGEKYNGPGGGVHRGNRPGKGRNRLEPIIALKDVL